MKTWATVFFTFFFVTAFSQNEKDTLSPFETIYIPNAITGDSIWIPCTSNLDVCDLKYYDLKVFNRWGEIMFSSNDPQEGWSPLADSLPDGVYIWVLKGIQMEDLNGDAILEENEVEFKGHLTFLK